MSAGDFFDEPSKSGDPELNKLEERIRKNKLSVAGEDVFLSNINGEFSDDSEGENVYQNLYLEAKEEAGKLSAELKNLNLDLKDSQEELYSLQQEFASTRLKNLKLILEIVLPLSEVDYPDIVNHKMSKINETIDSRTEQLKMELSNAEALEVIDHEELDREFDKWEDISTGVVGDVVRVLSKQKTWIAEMKEKLLATKDEGAREEIARLENLLREAELELEENRSRKEQVNRLGLSSADLRKDSLTGEAEHAKEIRELKKSYEAQIDKLNVQRERMIRNSNRSQEISEQMLKILRLQNENDELREEIQIQRQQIRETNEDYTKQIELLMEENRQLQNKADALKPSGDYEKTRTASWFDETSVDEVNARLLDLDCELRDARDKNDSLQQELDEILEDKHQNEERLKRKIWEMEQQTDPESGNLRSRIEELHSKLEIKQEQIHTLKNRLNERDLTVQRMQAEFAPQHEIETQVSRIQEEQRSILAGAQTKHKVTTERLQAQLLQQEKEIADYKDRLKIAEADFSSTNGGDDIDYLKKTKLLLAQNFAKEIERLRRDIFLLSSESKRRHKSTSSENSFFSLFWS